MAVLTPIAYVDRLLQKQFSSSSENFGSKEDFLIIQGLQQLFSIEAGSIMTVVPNQNV